MSAEAEPVQPERGRRRRRLRDGRDIGGELRDDATDVRRAAGADVPVGALAWRVLLGEAVGPQLQRVGVEEPGARGVDRRGQGVEDLALDRLGVGGGTGSAAGQQHAPGPVDVGDGRAGLGVGALAGQLVVVTERLVPVARAERTGDVHLALVRTGPLRVHRLEQREVALLEVDVRDAGVEVDLADGVADGVAGLPHGRVVLEVAGAESAGLEQAVTPLLDLVGGESR